jgi:hypothetical protein
MASLAGYLRELAEKGIFDIHDIVRKYESWVLEDKFMVMAHEREVWVSNAGETEYIALKCAKRGNDVYVSRVDSRLYGIGLNVPDIQHNFHENPFTSMLFITLTYDTKLCSFSEAWKQIGIEFNLYRANLRKKYGKFSVMRTWESYENGYPHVHAILIFEKKRFRVFQSYEQNRKGELKLVWRIHEKEEFEPYWHSWQDIKAVYNVRGGLNYLKKYILKCAKYSHDDKKGKQTLAMCWVFRKKAFYVSGQFRKALSDLIRSICSSKTRKVQVDLSGNVLEANRWKVLGFISAFFLDSIGIYSSETWTISLTSKQVAEIHDEWEKIKHYY